MESIKIEYTMVSKDDEVNAISACVEIIERHCVGEGVRGLDTDKAYNVADYLNTRYCLEASD